MAKKKRTKRKGGGSSMLNPPEREAYAEGSIAAKDASIDDDIDFTNTPFYDEDYPTKSNLHPKLEQMILQRLEEGASSRSEVEYGDYVRDAPPPLDKEDGKTFGRAFRKARNAGDKEFIWKGEPFHTRTLEEVESEEAGIDKVGEELMKNKKRREPRQAGGSMMVPPEMEMEASEAPVDTYPNIPPEEMAEVEASQLPDEEMEEGYIEFVMNEALDEEEQSYLMNTLEADPQLSMIFDKVVETASEFSGSGEVEGPGTGVSDSIPARLSKGEFVVTEKATDQLGADNLQSLMDEAERAFDGGLMSRDSGIEDEEIKKSMVASNQMPSLNVRQR